MAGKIPEKIGKYEISRQLGEGATSNVFLGTDPFAKRTVAVKLVHESALHDPKFGKVYKKLLLTEASLAGMLIHPHIANIYDAVVGEDQSYIVMEYVPGGTLENYCDSASLLAVNTVTEIVFKCCRALDFAQRNGVIHRDIKPANILLAENYEPKISDFGAAFLPKSETTQVSGIGSPAYMSPEQVKEHPLTHQTDIFSLGVVMYQMLTGKLPFQASNNASMIYQIVNVEPPPPSDFRPELPQSLDEIVLHALHKNLEQRYQTWGEFAQDLASLGQVMPSPEIFSDTEKFNMLRGLPFFRGFTDVELWEVLRISAFSKHPKGTILVREGEAGNSFFVLAQGEVKVMKGKRLLNVLSAGDCFGEMAYIGQPVPDRSVGVSTTSPLNVTQLQEPAQSIARSASVDTMTDVTLLNVNADALHRASDNCQLAFNKIFLSILVERLSLASSRLVKVLS